MNSKLLFVAAAMIAAPAFAQQAQSGPQGGQATSKQGVQIQGNTEINASQKDASAVATGQNNVAKNTAGAIKAGTQIQGNTKIGAKQEGATANVSGKNNKATNEAGTIGGN
jgi:hypothetical protein